MKSALIYTLTLAMWAVAIIFFGIMASAVSDLFMIGWGLGR